MHAAQTQSGRVFLVFALVFEWQGYVGCRQGCSGHFVAESRWGSVLVDLIVPEGISRDGREFSVACLVMLLFCTISGSHGLMNFYTFLD